MKDKYVLLTPKDSRVVGSSELTALFFDELKELNSYLFDTVRTTYSVLGQSMAEFSYVIDRNKEMPTTYEEFNKEWDKRVKSWKFRNGSAGYFVRREKKGKVVEKSYDFKEDFDWQLPEWEKNGWNVSVWMLDDGYEVDYYIKRDIIKQWGDKVGLFDNEEEIN